MERSAEVVVVGAGLSGLRAPMRWTIKAHAVYPDRFWTGDGLSGAAAADTGLVRTVADNSPPSSSPGILVGFVEEPDATAPVGADRRREAVLDEFRRLFGRQAASPLLYREKHWGEDPFARGAEGGYWAPGVWTTYGHALREPHGRIHWAGTETSAVWNGKMEGAVRSGTSVAHDILDARTRPG